MVRKSLLITIIIAVVIFSNLVFGLDRNNSNNAHICKKDCIKQYIGSVSECNSYYKDSVKICADQRRLSFRNCREISERLSRFSCILNFISNNSQCRDLANNNLKECKDNAKSKLNVCVNECKSEYVNNALINKSEIPQIINPPVNQAKVNETAVFVNCTSNPRLADGTSLLLDNYLQDDGYGNEIYVGLPPSSTGVWCDLLGTKYYWGTSSNIPTLGQGSEEAWTCYIQYGSVSKQIRCSKGPFYGI